MYPRAQRKKRTESMEAAAGEQDLEDAEEKDRQVAKGRRTHQRKDHSTTTTRATIPGSLASLAGKNFLFFQKRIGVVSNFIKKERLFLHFDRDQIASTSMS